MKISSISQRSRAFTLLETVIAIGVLAVLLTGFMYVFAPAADGIRKSINVQQADRLASTLEENLVTLRKDEASQTIVTGFDKAFDRIKGSNEDRTALVVYQYRAAMDADPRSNDGTPEPVAVVTDKLPGKDYVLKAVMRRVSDENFAKDLPAVEGAVYLVKCTQLVFNGGELQAGKAGQIVDPKGGGTSNIGASADYPEAVIAFSAEFHIMPAKSASYFSSAAFKSKFKSVKNPVFTRNLAVRR